MVLVLVYNDGLVILLVPSTVLNTTKPDQTKRNQKKPNQNHTVFLSFIHSFNLPFF